MFLFYLYVFSLVLGGILLGASLFLGDAHDGLEGDVGDADFDADADVDASAELEADADVDVSADLDADAHVAPALEASDLWLPIFSLRFWVFFLAFFGLTGTALTWLSLAGTIVTLICAVGLGFGAGFAAATIIRHLQQTSSEPVVTIEQYKGLEGALLLPLLPGGRSKLRLTINKRLVDVIARSDHPQELPRGSRVLVIDAVDSEAVVVPAKLLEE